MNSQVPFKTWLRSLVLETEYIFHQDGTKQLVWALYEEKNAEGKRPEKPIAWFIDEKDAIMFKRLEDIFKGL